MILPFNITLAANEVREVSLSGQYLELRSAPSVVAIVELNDRSGGVVSRMESAEATDFVRTQRNFEMVRITNGATAQTLRFYYGDGDSGSNRFTGVVSGEVSLAAATLAAMESVDLNPGTIAQIKPPNLELPTASWTNTAAMAANVPITIFTPAANANGALIISAGFRQYAAATWASIVFLAKNAPPAVITDGEVILFDDAMGGNLVTFASLKYPQLIAPGLGLYAISQDALAGNSATQANQRYCRYKLL